MKFNDDRCQMWEDTHAAAADDIFLTLYDDDNRDAQSKTKGRILITLISVLLITAFIIAVLCVVSGKHGAGSANEAPTVEIDADGPNTEWQGAFSSSEISEECLSVCVSIRLGAIGNYGSPSATGVVISSDGWILTCDNILNSSQIGRYYVKFYDGREYSVEQVKRIDGYGLLLMKIDAERLKSARIGEYGSVCAGQSIAAISSLGAPYHELAIRQCILSGVSRAEFTSEDAKLLRTDIEFDKVAMGSPIFDREGRVFGIALYENQKIILPIDEICENINEYM